MACNSGIYHADAICEVTEALEEILATVEILKDQTLASINALSSDMQTQLVQLQSIIGSYHKPSNTFIGAMGKMWAFNGSDKETEWEPKETCLIKLNQVTHWKHLSPPQGE